MAGGAAGHSHRIPGFGHSPPTDPPAPAAGAREVVALLDRLGLERAPIAGLSLVWEAPRRAMAAIEEVAAHG